MSDRPNLKVLDSALTRGFQGSALSASELQRLTGWQDIIVEDYLAFLRNLLTVARATKEIGDDLPDIEERLKKIESDIDDLSLSLLTLEAKVDNQGIRIDNIDTVLSAHDQRLIDLEADSHTHTNMGALDKVTDSGVGDLYLADDGVYKLPV